MRRVNALLQLILLFTATLVLCQQKKPAVGGVYQPWNKNVLKKCGGSGGCGGCGKGPDACAGGLNTGCCPPEHIKCCDPSCPKCIGGKAPRPGTGCLAGCPLGGCCPGTCPCDDCVCCYTSTTYSTVFTTCLNEVKLAVTRTTTKTKTTTTNLTETKIVPVTFSVDEIFLFTSTLVTTVIADRPSYTEETLKTVNIVSQSTIFLTTSSVTELSTTRTAGDVTVTTNPVIIITSFINSRTFTSLVDTFLPTTFTTERTTFVTGSFVTSFFGFNYTTSPVFTFAFNTTFAVNLTTVVDVFSSSIAFQTSPALIAGTSSIQIINSFVTSQYGTGVPTTVPGDWTFYEYQSRTATKTLLSTTIGFPTFTTASVEETVKTKEVCVVETSNICPTRTVDASKTDTVFVLATTTKGTQTVTFGTSTAVTTIASTIVFD